MELHWALQVVLIFFIGIFILRIGGRKSISQMTISQTIVMVGLGSLLIQPLAQKGIFIILLSALLFVLLMVATEYLEVKVDFLETLFAGKAVVVIEDGEPHITNLRKIRMSVDRLETRLRQSGISSIQDVQYATIEVSGQIGYKLKDNKQPLTRGDFMELMTNISEIRQIMQKSIKYPNNDAERNDIFEELINIKFEGNKNEP